MHVLTSFVPSVSLTTHRNQRCAARCVRRRSTIVRTRRRQCVIASNNVSSSNSTQCDALARFATELSDAHVHIDAASELLTPAMGAAERAEKSGVDIGALSIAYGHVLSKDAGKVGERLDIDAVAIALIDTANTSGALDVEPPASMQEFEMWLSTDGLRDSGTMSSMYGYVLGRALRASALELDVTLVADGLRAGVDGAAFPMEERTYDEKFGVLESHAAALTANTWQSVSDTFFGNLRSTNGVADLEGDGFVLAVDGVASDGNEVVAEGDGGLPEVDLVLHGRFLDGRSFVLPTHTDGFDMPADTVRVALQQLPGALRSGVLGMRVGQCRTLFLHPYAAVEVLDLFGGRDKFPPNVALVFDIFLHAIEHKLE